jgi:hypothetical protein
MARLKKMLLENSGLVERRGDLASRFPSVAAEWHPTKNEGKAPSDFRPFSNKKVWWLCEKGHEWVEVISKRTGRAKKCPFCSEKRVSAEHNLEVKHPAVAAEWHPTKNGRFKPFDALPHSGKRVWWLCAKGHEWQAPIARRTGGSGCPDCSGTRVTTLNNLAVLFPKVAKLWHPDKNGSLSPWHVRGGSNKKVWWTCGNGHEWHRRIQQQVRSRGCPICSSRFHENGP